MDTAKIRLSPKEAELVTNADWILTKNGILQKAKFLLEQLQSDQQEYLKMYLSTLPAEVMQISPKISKGENYKGLPYLVLDYPRFFENENHFAIRVMFWWGNFFSITLHLSGSYKRMYENKIHVALPLMKEKGFYICSGSDQWEHHFETSNYLSLEETDAALFKKYTGEKDFIKLAKKYPLEQWDSARDKLMASFSEMIKWLAT